MNPSPLKGWVKALSFMARNQEDLCQLPSNVEPSMFGTSKPRDTKTPDVYVIYVPRLEHIQGGRFQKGWGTLLIIIGFLIKK